MRNLVFHSAGICLAAALAICPVGRSAEAQDESARQPAQAQPPVAQPPALDELHAKFQQLLTGATLRGQFTVDGQALDQLQQESYEISKVEKLADSDDLWALTTRIKYGEHDVLIPIALQVKWAGATPVITLDELTIPGLGTFSARVLLHKDKYAGTWQHGTHGGHLFGHIELAKPPTQP